MDLCGCDCGDYVTKPGNKFIKGHNRRGIPSAFKGKKHAEETKRKQQLASLGNKNLLGYKHTDKTIEKLKRVGNTPEAISFSRNKAIKQNADPNSNFGPKKQGKGYESYPEKCFRKFLESMGAIKNIDFFQELHVGTYSLDFVFIDEQGKRCIEIDGGQHLKSKAIEHDKVRDTWLQNQGWIILRIPVKSLKQFLTPLWPTKIIEMQLV